MMNKEETASATVTERVAAPIDRVWEVLSDFSAMQRRTAGLTRFTVEGSGAGAVRTFQIGDGPVMRERLEVFDPVGYRFAYALLPPAFMENYLGEVQLKPDGPEACLVVWSGRCTVSSAQEAAERRVFFENVYRNGIAWVRKELGVLEKEGG
ncbi:MAG TPA: SRPBCC family protein [Alphaproteobacteria bacterium]|nr:SRPBCC family protein [Alphaproteobacteria bacterium]